MMCVLHRVTSLSRIFFFFSSSRILLELLIFDSRLMLTFIVSPTFEFRILVLDASRFFDIWHSKFDIRYYIFVFNIRYFDVQCSNIFDTLIGIDIFSICCFNLDLLIFFGMYT